MLCLQIGPDCRPLTSALKRSRLPFFHRPCRTYFSWPALKLKTTGKPITRASLTILSQASAGVCKRRRGTRFNNRINSYPLYFNFFYRVLEKTHLCPWLEISSGSVFFPHHPSLWLWQNIPTTFRPFQLTHSHPRTPQNIYPHHP